MPGIIIHTARYCCENLILRTEKKLQFCSLLRKAAAHFAMHSFSIFTTIVASAGLVSGSNLADADISTALRRVQFANEGTTRSNDTFFFSNIVPVGEGAKLMYLEADNVSCAQCVWADGAKYFVDHPYLFKEAEGPAVTTIAPKTTTTTSQCKPDPVQKGDRPGDDISVNTFPLGTNVSACTELCCNTGDCEAYVFIPDMPIAYQNCPVNSACCWIKDGVPGPAPCPAVYKDACESGTVQLPPPPPPTPLRGESPSSGMRSAVPLGGISTGSVELRGDGSLHEWIIHNAGPSGAAKIQEYPKAFFAMRVGSTARVLQTHPHVQGEAYGVSTIQYHGSHPVSKLVIEPRESSAPASRGGFNRQTFLFQDSGKGTVDLDAALYGFSALAVGNRVASARPAIAFPLDLHNSGSDNAVVSFMMNLPLLIEEDQLRAGTPLGTANFTIDAEACATRCMANAQCNSWVWTSPTDTGGGATQPAKCQLQTDAPLNVYSRGVTSGLRGSWVVEGASSECLTLVRPGVGPMHGNVSLCASSSDASATFRAIVADTAEEVFSNFSAEGGSGASTPLAGLYGAFVVEGTVPAGGDLALVLTMGWGFPNRDHYNYASPGGAGFVPFGNHYSQLYPSAADAASSMPLQETLDDIFAWQSALFPTPSSRDDGKWTVPSWLSDVLINSLSHSRDSMWWTSCPHCIVSQDARVNGTASNAEGGFWRQFEAYDCPDLDSIHNDGERHIPYIMFFPNGTRSKLAVRSLWFHCSPQLQVFVHQ